MAACIRPESPLADDIIASTAVVTPTTGPRRFGGVWRVQWNDGSPIVTPVTIDADGVQIGISPLALKGAATFFAYADGLKNGYVLLNAGHQTGHDYTDRVSMGLQSPDRLNGAPLRTVDAALQAKLALAAPPIFAPIGAQVLNGRIISRFITSSGTVNNYDVSLEDTMIWATGAVLTASSL